MIFDMVRDYGLTRIFQYIYFGKVTVGRGVDPDRSALF